MCTLRACATGPSPRAWGLLAVRTYDTIGFRAIPTCVGTTAQDIAAAKAQSGHPHVRGDYENPTHLASRSHGPSPRAWGLQLRATRRSERGRAIPTCVGTTSWTSGFCPASRGPSPRAWGLRLGNRRIRTKNRAIPTCVGTTQGVSPAPPGRPGHPHVRGDYRIEAPPVGGFSGHPHVRGDYGVDTVPSGLQTGPSPRAWGLRFSGMRVKTSQRAIPTCVGTTLGGQGRITSKVGPSPRAWGLRRSRGCTGGRGRAIPTCVGTTDHARMGCRNARAIPTCVGTTRPLPWRELPAPGHPHVRGDYPPGHADGPKHSGPSPRAWGLRPACPSPIPATPGHPHVRGDYARGTAVAPTLFGPSPRAWGLHLTRTAKIPSHPPLCVFSGDGAGKLVKLHSLEA